MKTNQILLPLLFAGLICLGSKTPENKWITERYSEYDLFYQTVDKNNVEDYTVFLSSGIGSVESFFGISFPEKFNVFVHPNRSSLDSTWQHDWNMPEFKSECWMVASGVASKLDMLSPKAWDTESCEHKYSDTLRTQNLIVHELVHVFHGQMNASPDFSDTEAINWFIEGLATYASGQCDSLRMAEVGQAISDNNIPESLDEFWTGKLRYGLCGSVVMFIDNKYGRDKLCALLQFNKKAALLGSLNTTESALLEEWKKYMLTP